MRPGECDGRSVLAGLVGLTGLSGPAGASDSEFMIRAVVTREGTVANPELVHAMSDQKPIAPGTEEAKAAETLMGAVSRTRVRTGARRWPGAWP